VPNVRFAPVVPWAKTGPGSSIPHRTKVFWVTILFSLIGENQGFGTI
jgi:hypothetical protein